MDSEVPLLKSAIILYINSHENIKIYEIEERTEHDKYK